MSSVRDKYINADKFITTIDSSDVLDAYSAITVCDLIKNESPADVRENVHGEWLNGRCNQCGEHAPFWAMASTYYQSNFCPNCGTDMRKGENDG